MTGARSFFFRLWQHSLFVSRVHMQLPGQWLRRSCLLFRLLWPLGEKRRKLLGGYSPSTLPSPSPHLPPFLPLYPPFIQVWRTIEESSQCWHQEVLSHQLYCGGYLFHHVLYLCSCLLVRLYGYTTTTRCIYTMDIILLQVWLRVAYRL